MQDLIESIRAALAEGATLEQKTTGVQACSTIMAALGAEPGKPIALPGVPRPGPLSGMSAHQALDLLIARLTVVAQERERAEEQLPTSPPPALGPRIPMVPAPPTARRLSRRVR